jgi:radical SAM protein with 4Fe4S-binding SPASM domain
VRLPRCYRTHEEIPSRPAIFRILRKYRPAHITPRREIRCLLVRTDHLGGSRQDVWVGRDVDGSVYRVVDAYEEPLSLGNLATQSINQILDSERYRESLKRDRLEFERHCAQCLYQGACPSSHIYDSRVSEHEGNCPTAFHCIAFMQNYIERRGYSRDDIAVLLRETWHADRTRGAGSSNAVGV